MDNETWLIEEGDLIIRKMAALGFDNLTDRERLVYAFWVADYSMRNAGDLDAASDVFADWQAVAFGAAKQLSLPIAKKAFALNPAALQQRYFDLFNAVCDEIRSAKANVEPDAAT